MIENFFILVEVGVIGILIDFLAVSGPITMNYGFKELRLDIRDFAVGPFLSILRTH